MRRGGGGGQAGWQRQGHGMAVPPRVPLVEPPMNNEDICIHELCSSGLYKTNNINYNFECLSSMEQVRQKEIIALGHA